MNRPRILDLFCGAGGAAMGYHRAGFDVVGVDINPQPHYPFEFIQMDAMEFLRGKTATLNFEYGFDAVHASPPCQAYTQMRRLGKSAGEGAPELIEPVRATLIATGLPWVMENVVSSPLVNPLRLCGTSFGLGVDRAGEWQQLQRHRLFESSHLIFGLPCKHSDAPTLPVWGDGRPSRQEARRARALAVYGDHPQRTTKGVNRAQTLAEAQTAMDMQWVPDWHGVKEAIPPAYTEWIGRQLIAVVGRRGRDAA